MNDTPRQKSGKRKKDTEARVPPSDLQAEQAVLGSVILSDVALAKVTDYVSAESFYWKKHSLIFDAVMSLTKRSDPVDFVTVSHELKKMDSLEEVGGDYYLSELTEATALPFNADYYAKIVEQKYLLRKLIEVGAEIGENAFNASATPETELDVTITKLFELQKTHKQGGYRDLNTISHTTMEELERLKAYKGEITGVTSGFPKLDDKTGGFQQSDLIILAGRPSMGKTSLGLSFAYNAAKYKRIPVGVISLEMNARQIAMRLLSFESKIPLYTIRSGRFSDPQWRKAIESISNISQLPIYIDESSIQSITDIRARARRLQMQYNVEMIVLDYLQLIQPPDRIESQQQFIANVSRQLKGLAKELDIPIITISQLSRAVETRGGSKRPILSDLRDSGAIEQDADVVMFVYREAYYKRQEGEKIDPNDEDENKTEVIIAKQRNGPTGTIELVFMDQFALFANLTKDVQPRPRQSDEQGIPF